MSVIFCLYKLRMINYLSLLQFFFFIIIIDLFYLFQLFSESNNEREIEIKDIDSDQSQRILCKQIVEVCLYILWAHTDFYFMQSPVQNVHRPKGLNSK